MSNNFESTPNPVRTPSPVVGEGGGEGHSSGFVALIKHTLSPALPRDGGEGFGERRPTCSQSLLNPGFDLTLRPMRYPRFYEMYRAAIKNTWTVEEIDFQIDLGHLRQRMTPADRHMVERLVAFFATGDSIVSNNLVVSLYRHINSPEARMYLSRQLFEEALHIQFYLTLLDNYVPDQARRAQVFAAIDTIPSIRRKAEFCKKWTDQVYAIDRVDSHADKRRFLLNLTCFASCIEGLFFFGAFAYVYFLRSRGLLPGLAAGTSWVFRDESAHMAFAVEVLSTVRREEPGLFDAEWAAQVQAMIEEAVDCEAQFAEDVLAGGVVGLTQREMRQYLEYVADQRLTMLALPKRYGARNPFPFMDLQDVQELTNFFERRVSAYQMAVQGEVAFDRAF
jgi:ribonucleoside-diphosphate reductase beta chain